MNPGGADRRHPGSCVSAKEQTRTADRTIFSRELYQLSYLGLIVPAWPPVWAIEDSNL